MRCCAWGLIVFVTEFRPVVCKNREKRLAGSRVGLCRRLGRWRRHKNRHEKGYDMSLNLKSKLLASALIGFSAVSAQAQTAVTVLYPAATIHAAGASSVAVLLPSEFNAITGKNQDLGDNSGGDTALNGLLSNGFQANGANIAAGAAISALQPNLTAQYISTGSGNGRKMYDALNISGYFAAGASNWPTAAVGAQTNWSTLQFVMSDTAAAASDFSTFVSKQATTGVKAGAPIEFPLYVLPVAIGFSPAYGFNTATNTVYTLNIQATQSINGSTVPELKLSKRVYCGIFNGYITNWNDAKITALNTATVGKTVTAVSLADKNDTTRWAADGLPIRLVGRLDNSGTTDIFTRHLATVCGGGIMGTSNPNKYLTNNQSLPYAGVADFTGDNFAAKIAGTKYVAANAAAGTGTFAGTSDLIAGVLYDPTIASTTPAAEAALFPAVAGGLRSTTGGTGAYTEVAGKFIVANTSSGVAYALELAPDKPSASNSAVLLNGKIGYLGADWVKPSTNLAKTDNLIAATLEVGQTSTAKTPVWAYPTAANGVASFSTTILPPESDAKGNFVAGGSFSRGKPSDWYEALYSGTSTLANPVVGYPITGTTELLTGTCFSSTATRNAITAVISAVVGQISGSFTGTNGGTAWTSAKAAKNNPFSSTVAGSFGFPSELGIAALPASWQNAIVSTFFTPAATLKKYPGLAKEVNYNGATGPLYIQEGIAIGQAVPTGTKTTKGVTTTVIGKLAAGAAETAAQIDYETPASAACTAGNGL